jgi:hypothetical protein
MLAIVGDIMSLSSIVTVDNTTGILANPCFFDPKMHRFTEIKVKYA